ncbi:MAG: T9SS type A sorting domain-containing protein [candidate division Zixibacteria bacterium]|nr:T9SS type A sorting domain-containing protein [candidate division Zixibacteria bacterium]
MDDDPEEEGYPYPRRIWRNFPPLGSDSINLMDKLKWGTMVVELSSDSDFVYNTPPHAFISLIAQTKRKWRQEKDTLLATLTFRVQDSMTICIDTTFWPPGSHLLFVRHDNSPYIPRDNLPLCIKVKSDGSVDTTDVRWIEGSTEEESKPTTFLLSQNYPNPFNPVTNFKFSLPKASHVKIEIFNILGQKVKTLVDEDMKAGSFVVDWDGKDQRGVEVSSGIYFYRMIAEDFSSVKRMVLLK